MKITNFIPLLILASAALASDERTLLARIESKGAQATEVTVVHFFLRGSEVEVQGIAKVPQAVPIGAMASARLLERLARIKLPDIDYQRHFDSLAHGKKTPGKGPERPGRNWGELDGSSVQVELRVRGQKVLFRVNSPETFFYVHDDDEGAVAVGEVLDALVLAVSRSRLF